MDKSTNEPIADVFIFIDNSSIGTTSDDSGKYSLDINVDLGQSLVFSHINYELLKIQANINYLNTDTIKLIPYTKLIEEVSIIEKNNPRIRARRVNRFKETFLGYDYNSKLIKLLNPETLLFIKNKNKLDVTAMEPLKVENKLLGYNLLFYLEKFTLYENDDLFIKGSVFFEPLDGKRKEKARFKRNQKKLFKKSSRKFFSELASLNTLSEDEYQLGFSSLNINREFVHYTPIPNDSLKVEQIETDLFKIEINRYLTVSLKNIVIAPNAASGLAPNFSTGLKSINNDNLNFATSYLKSRSNKILFNSKGQLLNSIEVEEYGYWAQQRVADMLPNNFVN